jgi:hypothetical protein
MHPAQVLTRILRFDRKPNMKSQTIRVARRSRQWLWLLTWVLSFDAVAQGLSPAPQAPQLPVPPASALPLPTQQLPAQPTAFDPNNPAGTSPRFLFAGAVAMIAKSVGTSVVSGLSQGIVNWFNSSANVGGPQFGGTPWVPPPPMGAPYPGALPGPQALGPPPMPGGYGQVGGAAQPFPTGAPPAATPGAAPSALPPPMPVASGGIPAANAGIPGMPAPVAAAPTAAVMTTPATPTLYAGIAFEVHVVGAGGTETVVDPSTYVFHSGERFVVYYRPSLPGRVHVFNVSPTGEVIPIETLTLAAAELAKLGPYQLTDPAGDEALRLVLEPCSSPELVAATRNIVKASDSPSGSDLHIGSCPAQSSPAPGVGTRNIVKATMDGSTGFALDSVSSQELASGRLTPRETTIAIHHR